MTFEQANQMIRDAVAARHAETAAKEQDCPGCEGNPFRPKVAVAAPAVATAIDLTQELPSEFIEATKHITFRPASPVPQADFKIERIGTSIPPDHLEDAWGGIKARHDQMMEKIRGENVEPIETTVMYPPGVKVATTRLIGIAGPAGCGKNTVAAMIPDAVVIGFADPLYAALSVLLGIPEAVLRSRAAKERPIDWIGKSPRQMLQTLGTNWGRELVMDDLWITLAARRIDALEQAGTPVVAIADVRFDNEAEMIRSRGGEVWSLIRTPASETYSHVSEAGISGSLIDRRIDNTGTPEQTRELVTAALAE